MATAANVHDLRRPPVPVSVAEEYQDTLRTITALEEQCLFWDSVLGSKFFTEFTEKLEEEIRKIAISWKDPSYKDSLYPQDKRRVLAIEKVLADLREHAADKRQSLSTSRKLRTTLEDQYPLLIGPGPERRVASVQPVPAAAATATAEPEAPAQGQVTLHIVTRPLGKKKEEKALRKLLAQGGFALGEQTEKSWAWSAQASQVADGAYDEIYQIEDESLILSMREDDPSQTEIPVDGSEDEPVDLNSEGEPDEQLFTDEQDQVDEMESQGGIKIGDWVRIKAESSSLHGGKEGAVTDIQRIGDAPYYIVGAVDKQGWLAKDLEFASAPRAARKCVVVTRHLDQDLDGTDLIQILEGCGFSRESQREADPDLEGDAGEDVWSADYCEDQEVCMNGLDDERILERKVC